MPPKVFKLGMNSSKPTKKILKNPTHPPESTPKHKKTAPPLSILQDAETTPKSPTSLLVAFKELNANHETATTEPPKETAQTSLDETQIPSKEPLITLETNPTLPPLCELDLVPSKSPKLPSFELKSSTNGKAAQTCMDAQAITPKNPNLAPTPPKIQTENSSSPNTPKNDNPTTKPPQNQPLDFTSTLDRKQPTTTRDHPSSPSPLDTNSPSLDMDHFPPLTPSSNHTKAPNVPPPINPPQFASLFKPNRLPHKCKPLEVEPKEEMILVEDDDLLSIEDAWGHALIGYWVGTVPNARAVGELVKTWGVPCKFSFHKHGWVVFLFDDGVARDGVLEKGPYISYGRPWIIRPVPKLFTFSDACFSSVPIWINLHKLPKQCWSKKVLSKIGSQLGTPVSMDMITSECLLHDSARILVEVDISEEPKTSIPLRMPDGRIWEQPIHYEVEPFLCSKCHMLGHRTEACQGLRPPRPRDRSVGRRGRDASKNPAPKIPEIGKGKEKVVVPEARVTEIAPTTEVQPGPVQRQGASTSGHQSGDRSVVLALQSPPVAPQTTTETAPIRVESPNPFAVLSATSDEGGTARADVTFEASGMSEADDDLLQDDSMAEEEETVRVRATRGKRRARRRATRSIL